MAGISRWVDRETYNLTRLVTNRCLSKAAQPLAFYSLKPEEWPRLRHGQDGRAITNHQTTI
jgi:hypothetical protein